MLATASIPCFHAISASRVASMDLAPCFSSSEIISATVSTWASMVVVPFENAPGDCGEYDLQTLAKALTGRGHESTHMKQFGNPEIVSPR